MNPKKRLKGNIMRTKKTMIPKRRAPINPPTKSLRRLNLMIPLKSPQLQQQRRLMEVPPRRRSRRSVRLHFASPLQKKVHRRSRRKPKRGRWHRGRKKKEAEEAKEGAVAPWA